MASAATGDEDEELVNVDSGANRLIIKNKNYFDVIVIRRGSLNLAGQEANLIVQGVGSIGSFQNVKWCPTARDNLLSVEKMVSSDSK